VKGLRILDIGCGQGYFSRVLASRAAKVTGIDLSPKMIAIAMVHEKKRPLGVEYRVMDARGITSAWASGSFDLVTACMSLHDMPTPGRVIHSASRVLGDDGGMAFSVAHSVNHSWGRWVEEHGKKVVQIADYLRNGRYVVPWDMPRLREHWLTVSYNFTISDWSKMIENSGFLIQRIYEPRPTKSQAKRHPELEESSRIPFFLVFRLSWKQPAA
jgi:ubiquinone/menaquinone biosynthesis C-methylase UbiE